ncbi:MAG TPA: phosphoglucomutase/phosphomannomutase family protein [Chloroflexia bacterium]|nr:phosphoglucomutase/phosphomannomutase family protein [Chloroflexia bacterium]
MAQIKFGTDGWRAVIAEDYTFDNVRKVSQAAADYVRSDGRANQGVVVGYDTRFGSEHFAAAVAEVLAGNGIKTLLTNKFTPTPVVSYAIIEKQAGAGIVITASHNPPTDNGFKFKPYYGGSASPEIVDELEKRLDQEIKRMPLEQAKAQGLVEYFDPSDSYIAQLEKIVDVEGLRNSNIKIAVDPMWGAGQGYYPRILGGGKVQVTQLHGERNPIFPNMHNPEPIAKNLTDLINLMKSGEYNLGIANDGDADRVGIVDETGRFLNQLEVYALLALYMLEVRGERGPLVKSLSSTSMAEKLGQLYGVEVYETPVGFKHIGPKMMETNAILGGEESGGFGFRGHIPERDGILSGLIIADMMAKLKTNASGLLKYLFEKVGPHYYDRIDFKFDQSKRQEIMDRLATNPPKEIAGMPVVRSRTDDGFKYYTEDGSWLLIRFSGTEPIMRAYTEMSSPEKVQQVLQQGRSLTGV